MNTESIFICSYTRRKISLLIFRCCQYLDYAYSAKWQITDEYWIRKGLERGGVGPIEEIFWHVSGGTQENHESPRKSAEVRTKHLSNTGLELARYEMQEHCPYIRMWEWVRILQDRATKAPGDTMIVSVGSVSLIILGGLAVSNLITLGEDNCLGIRTSKLGI